MAALSLQRVGKSAVTAGVRVSTLGATGRLAGSWRAEGIAQASLRSVSVKSLPVNSKGSSASRATA